MLIVSPSRRRAASPERLLGRLPDDPGVADLGLDGAVEVGGGQEGAAVDASGSSCGGRLACMHMTLTLGAARDQALLDS